MQSDQEVWIGGEGLLLTGLLLATVRTPMAESACCAVRTQRFASTDTVAAPPTSTSSILTLAVQTGCTEDIRRTELAVVALSTVPAVLHLDCVDTKVFKFLHSSQLGRF